MESNTTLQGLRGHCPAPFFEETAFPATGGFIPGRLCVQVSKLDATCCVPCPYSDWTYSDGFEQRTEIANWVNVAAMFCTVFVLLSFFILPVKWTHRHYLSICLALGVFCLEISFLIPLVTEPTQCFNEITPNDMKSNRSCAFSGAFLLFGGWAIVIWVFWRALSLHLQICWQVVPGPKFFYSALILGWGIPALGLAIILSVTGVSYRFGSVCHINHKHGLEDFWGPLLAFATLALVLQFITIGYCVQVYIRSLLDGRQPSTGSSSAPSYPGSTSTASAKQTYRRVKKMVELQWRGATIVLLIIAEVIFFSVIFVSMDNNSQVNEDLFDRAVPWITCLALTGGNKNQCLPQAEGLVKDEALVVAVLVCLGLSGFWLLLFLGRWSMVLGWYELIQRKCQPRRNEFVSADAGHRSYDLRMYEMLDSVKTTPALTLQPPEQVFSPSQAHPLRSSPMTPEVDHSQVYFDRKPSVRTAKFGQSPTSTITSPSSPGMFSREWDDIGRDPQIDLRSYSKRDCSRDMV